MSNSSSSHAWRELTKCPPAELHFAALAYRVGYDDGRRSVAADMEIAGRAAAKLAAPILRRPDRAELAQRRRVDHEPCPIRCNSCSRCIHAEAWARRGGRDYLGVAQEAEIARRAA